MAQTLAFTYNIEFCGTPTIPSCYCTETVAQHGCASFITPDLIALGLSTSSTVNDVLSVANQLINDSTIGGTTTQTQASDMFNLLTCLNRES